MAKAIMVQGTMSNAGKSLTAAGLCRIFKQDGYRVAPFKSQNMALNSYITKDGLEMGRAQVVQAEAAGVEPDVRMNPVLLKPTSDVGTQVIVNGVPIGNMPAVEYFAYKKQLIRPIQQTYDALAAEYDMIVLEGAGSPAEINLKENDIVNMGMARMAKAPVLLVGDIDRGGVFASLYGTVMLLPPEERAFIKATVINKFRGDVSLLKPGLAMLEELTKIPVAGVVPYLSVKIDDEDSLSGRLEEKRLPSIIDIAVIRLPHISNFTDFNVLEEIPGVSLRYVSSVQEVGTPDCIILPGTKNTMQDLRWMRQNGLEAVVKRHVAAQKILFGICGGYQMLGRSLKDPLGVETGGEMQGMEILPVDTIFAAEKVRTRVTGQFDEMEGQFSRFSRIPFTGYEIHMGHTLPAEASALPLLHISSAESPAGYYRQHIAGTYIHGVFDEPQVSAALIQTLLRQKGLPEDTVQTPDMKQYKEEQYNRLADSLRQSLDMEMIYRIVEQGI